MKAALAVLSLIAAPVLAAPPADLDARVERLRQEAGAVGIALAIVENGQTTLAKGWGFRKLGSPERVDADTTFLTGSTGKAFTSAALATLIDEGKLKWDDRVTDHLPGFQMYDPYVTREMTVRDLLVHRSGLGLGQGDLMYIPRGGAIARAEIVRRVRYLKPATSFRSGYAYDNVLYTVAGALVEAVSGQSWESYVRDHVLRAAGMARSTTDDARLADPNRAWPHGRTGGIVRGLGTQATLRDDDQVSQASAPAGLIAISANDMAAWLKLQLAHGARPDGTRVFSEATAKEMWTPQTIEPIATQPPGFEAIQPNFSTYALGWEVRDYAGHKLVMHGGGLWGFISTVVLIPDLNVGFALEMNSEDAAIRAGLMWELIDHYLGRPKQDWPSKYAALLKQRIAGAEAAVKVKTTAPSKAGPSLPLGRYVGTYADPWYGNIVIAPAGKGLTIDFAQTPRMKGRLEHYQYDTFVTHFDDSALEAAYVSFGLGADGGIERITMKPVSPIADFSYDYQDLLFTPVAATK